MKLDKNSSPQTLVVLPDQILTNKKPELEIKELYMAANLIV